MDNCCRCGLTRQNIFDTKSQAKTTGNKSSSKKGKVILEYPVLDIVAIVLAIVSIIVSILVAVGIVGVHKRTDNVHNALKDIHETIKKTGIGNGNGNGIGNGTGKK